MSRMRCSTRPVVEITTTMQPTRAHRDDLDVAHLRPRQRRVLHDRHLAGHLSEQPHGPQHDVVEVDRTFEEGADGPSLGGGQRLDRGEPIDEEAVAGVGGDASGAGVRLGDVALVLQQRHVVADRGRRDTEGVPLGERLRPDRLAGGDVVLDDGAQDRELALVEHGHLRRSRRRQVEHVWHSLSTECHATVRTPSASASTPDSRLASRVWAASTSSWPASPRALARAFERVRQLAESVVPEAEQGTPYGITARRYRGKPLIGFADARTRLSALPLGRPRWSRRCAGSASPTDDSPVIDAVEFCRALSGRTQIGRGRDVVRTSARDS